MPFISTRVNCPVDQASEKELSKRFGRDIELIPGKTEDWLMLQFEDNCRMYFKGDCSQKLAFVKVMLYGKPSGDAYDKLTGAITKSLREVLGVGADKVYVEYETTEHWGWNGSEL